MGEISVGNTQVAVGIDGEMIQEIVRRVLSVAQPVRIILFGSAAAGGMTPDSDIDLLVVEAEPADRQEEYVRIRQALGNLDYPFDILFISAQWFEESKGVIGGIAYAAQEYGRVIYDAP
jgi:predicted nucleotidyltransferase